MSSFQRSSSSNKEKKRLHNERDRERRKNETPQQREARLAKRRVKDATSYKIYGVTMTILHNWLELAPLMLCIRLVIIIIIIITLPAALSLLKASS